MCVCFVHSYHSRITAFLPLVPTLLCLIFPHILFNIPQSAGINRSPLLFVTIIFRPSKIVSKAPAASATSSSDGGAPIGIGGVGGGGFNGNGIAAGGGIGGGGVPMLQIGGRNRSLPILQKQAANGPNSARSQKGN